MKSFSFLFLVLFLGLGAVAAEPAAPAPPHARAPQQPLGHNVYYVRAHLLPDDLPASSPQHQGTLVLDVRFVTAGDDAARAFAAWLKFQASPAAPVLVLLNAKTAPALLAVLTGDQSPAGVVSIGPVDDYIKPDIALHITADADRLAYDAFEHGTSLAELITPKLDKARHDEATMNRERATGGAAESDSDADEDFLPPTPVASAQASAPPPVAPVDAVLQRALQLHRALVALKKIK